jgi:hypothetical protein
MNDDDRFLLDLVCGDLDETDPTVRARLDADPRLRARLDAMRAVERDIAAASAASDELTAEARDLVHPDDRTRVALALRAAPRRGRRAWWLAAAGVAAISLLVLLRHGAPPVDGRLGSTSDVELRHEGARWTVVVRDALPPGTSYHLRLELADGSSMTASAEARTWQFPDAWNQAVGRVQAGRLVVEWDDGTGLLVRRVLSLP